METSVIGGFTTYHTELSNDELSLFKKVTANLLGVHYTPLAVSHQVVNGINYSFFCNAKGAYPSATNKAAMVKIYAPTTGDAHITAIHAID